MSEGRVVERAFEVGEHVGPGEEERDAREDEEPDGGLGEAPGRERRSHLDGECADEGKVAREREVVWREGHDVGGFL